MNDSDRHARVLVALNVLTGNISPHSLPEHLDMEERAVLDTFRAVRKWGFGEMRLVVRAHQLDTIHETKTRNRKDL